MTLALSLLFIGAGLLALGSLMNSADRARRYLRGLETLPAHTPYVGPLFSRQGREVMPEGGLRYV